MQVNQETKRDEYISEVEKFAVYVNTEEKIVGIYRTNEDLLKANKNYALKKLKNRFGYRVQMVIK